MKQPQRLFLSGISGLLGLNAAFQWRDRFTISGAYRSQPIAIPDVEAVALDLEDPASVHAAVERFKPDVIVHTAALTDVDRCEREPALANRLNCDVARTVAHAAQATGARFVHLSTDHLFGGDHSFYGEADEARPVNVYARTKLEAERVVQHMCPDALIVRTNFVGWGTSRRLSTIDRVLAGLSGSAPLRLFTDVFTTPIAINDLLDCLVELIERRVTGVLNVAGAERISRYEFGLNTARVFGHATGQIEPSTMESLRLTARRPRDMSLSTERVSELLGHRMPDAGDCLRRLKQLHDEGWRDELEAALRPITPAALNHT